MGALMRAHDWRKTPLDLLETWPQPLKTLVSVMLGSKQPMFVVWGPERTLLYNDAYAEILVTKHPAALGCDFLEVWSEISADLAPIVDQAYAGEPVHMDDIALIMERRGHPEETHFAFSYTPVRGADGAVAGFFCPCVEITGQVLAERRQAFRLALEENLRRVADPGEIVAIAAEALGRHLGVGQITYAEVDADGEFVTIDREWNNGTIASNAGRHRLNDYGPAFISDLRRGEITVIGDVRLDARTSSRQALAAFARASIGGLLNVPLIKAERLVAILGVHDAAPRTWSADDVTLAQEVAERTWAAVERAQAEARLHETSGRLNAVLDNASVSIFLIDGDHRCLYMNPAAEALTGYALAETQGRHLHDVIHHTRPDGTPYPSSECPIDGVSPDTAREQGEEVFVHKSGLFLPVAFTASAIRDKTGAPVGTIVEVQDIAERKAAETALRESEARFRLMADAVPAIVWVTDADGRNQFFNRQWFEYTGAESAPTSAAQVSDDHVHPDDRAATMAGFEEAQRTEGTFRVEHRIRSKDGDYRWFLVRGEPHRGSGTGEIVRWFGASVDIQDRREAEAALHELNETLELRVEERTAELEQAHEQLRQSQKLEAMGQLTGGVSHDFNNLLSPIIGGLDLLQRKGLGSQREQRLINGALQSAERARVLVQRLLAFARRQPLQPRAVDLGALVSGMADLIASTSGPQIKVVVDVAEDLPAAVADSNQVEMAILNLSVNARDAMEGGGTLRISAQAETVDAGHRSRLHPGRYVRLSVADTGIGMDETTLTKAIEPFFSTKGVGRGTGLGLSMVHGLALQLGGALTLESQPGLGTNIEIWLPTSDEAALQPERVDDEMERPVAGTALLVDDEELVRASTADMLADLGYNVVEAGSAEEALRLVEGRLAFDVLVTDHLMPGMIGTELAREVRDRRPKARVLVISGYADVKGVAHGLPRLVKPFRQADLAAKLSELDEASAG